MVIGLVIYLGGQRYLPAQAQVPRVVQPSAPRENMARDTWLLLFGLGAAVAVFRSATSRSATPWRCGRYRRDEEWWVEFWIPMTWFIALNPLW